MSRRFTQSEPFLCHDPNGVFLRRWLPEATAARQARDRLWVRRRQPGFREQADAIVERHGSRRTGLGASGGVRRRKSGAGAPASQGVIQLGLDL